MASPKMDLKVLVLPVMLLLSKKVDLSDPEILHYVKIGFITVAAIMLSVYYYVYTRVVARSDKDKSIWISKPKPTLPFGLGPPPEPLKPEDFDESTYGKHEQKLLMEAVQGILMSGGISFLMSMKFNVHMSLLIQAVMMPLNALDMIVLKKYLLGTQKNADGSNLYNEFLSQPTLKSLDIAEKLKVARSTLSPVVAKSAISPDEPRVEELPNESEEEQEKELADVLPKKKSTAAAAVYDSSSTANNATTATAANEID